MTFLRPELREIESHTGSAIHDRPPSQSSQFGFDALRVGAMAFVALRHWLSISGFENESIPRCLGIGIFSALSGYLALRPGRPDDPAGWLFRRLKRIYPPYVLAVSAILLLNFLYTYKPLYRGLAAAQLLGVAYFTHPGRLVGVHTWFISMILVCYALAALIRWDRRAWIIAAFVVTSLLKDPDFAGCVIAFLVGGMVAGTTKRSLPWVAIAACWIAFATTPRGLLYPGIGVPAVLLGKRLPNLKVRWLQRAKEFAYEFYLVHGPVYLGLAVVLRLHYLVNLVVGTALALLAAGTLGTASRNLTKVITRMISRVQTEWAANWSARPHRDIHAGAGPARAPIASWPPSLNPSTVYVGARAAYDLPRGPENRPGFHSHARRSTG